MSFIFLKCFLDNNLNFCFFSLLCAFQQGFDYDKRFAKKVDAHIILLLLFTFKKLFTQNCTILVATCTILLASSHSNGNADGRPQWLSQSTFYRCMIIATKLLCAESPSRLRAPDWTQVMRDCCHHCEGLGTFSEHCCIVEYPSVPR